ncbi:MAG: ABC transporter permease, partial [Bacteroidota bacterium]
MSRLDKSLTFGKFVLEGGKSTVCPSFCAFGLSPELAPTLFSTFRLPNSARMLFFKILSESIRQALAQLSGNKLRTFLSLLGISIGIFCIIGVLSAVDSLEKNISGSLAKLGDDVVYIDKWPWKDNSGDWWEYFQRPFPDYA